MSYSIQLKNGEMVTIPSGIFATGDSHNAVTVTDTSSINLSLSGQDISGNVLSSGVDHQSLASILGSTSYYHLSSGNYDKVNSLSSSLTTGYLTSGNNISLLTNDTGYTTHSAVTVTDTTSVDFTLTGQDISANVLSSGVDHQSLDGILGSTSYYHVSSGVYAVLTTGLSSSFSSGDYVPYSNATSTVALGNYGISGSTATFSSGISANNASLTSGLTATTGNFSSGIRVLGGATITALATLSSNATVAGNLGVSSGATITGTLSVTGNSTMSGALSLTGNFLTSGTAGITGLGTFSSGVNIVYRLGVGTTGPSTFFHGYGTNPQLNIQANATGGAIRIAGLGSDDLVDWYLGHDSAGLPERVILRSGDSSGYLLFQTGGTNNSMIIDSTGNVGIGTTGPAAKLEIVQTTTGGTGSFYIKHSATSAPTNAVLAIGNSDLSNQYLRIEQNGRVSIGTTNPSYQLQVGSTAAGSSGTTDIFARNSVSAMAYIDRTPYPESKEIAYASVLSMAQSSAGGIDHAKLSSFLKVEDYGRDLSATVSAQNCVMQDLIKRIEKLENIN